MGQIHDLADLIAEFEATALNASDRARLAEDAVSQRIWSRTALVWRQAAESVRQRLPRECRR